MAIWNKTIITKYGLELNARALTEHKRVEIYEARGGNRENLNLTAMPVKFDITGKTSKNNMAHIVLQKNNAGLGEILQFNAIGIYARLEGDPQGETLLPYATVTTKNEEMETIPPESTQYKVLRLDVLVAYENTENILVQPTINLGVTKEQALNLIKIHNKDENAHENIFEKLKTWINKIFATKNELKELKQYSDGTYQGKGDYATRPEIARQVQTNNLLVNDNSTNDYISIGTKNKETFIYYPITKKTIWFNPPGDEEHVVYESSLKSKLLNIMGIRYDISENGYISFGPLFGGLIIQWGIAKNLPRFETDETTISFPIQFIKSAIIPLVSINYKRLGFNRAQTSNDFSIGTADVSTNNFRITLEAFSNSYDPTNALVYWLVVGR